MTPLSCACQMGHKDVVRVLLEGGGVELNSRDEEGRTPFSYAAESGSENVVQLLLEKGADPNLFDES